MVVGTGPPLERLTTHALWASSHAVYIRATAAKWLRSRLGRRGPSDSRAPDRYAVRTQERLAQAASVSESGGNVIKRSPADVLKLVKDEGVEIIDVRFADLPGMTQHFSVPAHELSEDRFTEGFGFDGSSIRGVQEIQESDMILLPDPNLAYLDPFRQHKTLNIHCFVHDPVTLDPYSRDPRHIARKAEAYLQSTGIADTAYFGPEAEYFIFDHVEYGQGVNYGTYRIDSIEGHWNTTDGEYPNLGYKMRPQEGYFPVPPNDKFQDLRSEMLLSLERLNIEMEVQHHEVATAGQAEMDMRFDTLALMADKLAVYKYVVH